MGYVVFVGSVRVGTGGVRARNLGIFFSFRVCVCVPCQIRCLIITVMEEKFWHEFFS